MVVLALEKMHDLADAVDAAPGIFGLAVPNPPAQPLDLRDDHGLRLHPTRLISRQSDCRLLGVLEPHGDMEPVGDWWIRDPGLGQNRSQTGAAVGERGQLRVVGSAHRLQVSADQHGEVGIGPRDSAEYLPASDSRLDVADANFAWGDDCQAFSGLWHATVTPLCCLRDDQRGALPWARIAPQPCIR